MCLVLIVEDNVTFRHSLMDVLRTQFPSMGIEEASDSEEALLKLRVLEPDLIFMDIKLPGRNGLELTRTIKSTNSAIEIIILTSYDIPEYREAAIRSGASHFLTKGNASGDDIAHVVVSTLASRGKRCETPNPACRGCVTGHPG
ncbi:MAG: response regulator transcription factor [Syntrophobacteraceae bacterium]